MSKYKITAVDPTKGHVTFQTLTDANVVVRTDTRGDLPVDDFVAVDSILSAYANAVVEDSLAVKTIDPALTAKVGVAQTAKTKAELEAK